MSLFTPNLYRNFAIGFVGGALIVAVVNVDNWADEITPPAQAAEMIAAPPPADNFWSIAE